MQRLFLSSARSVRGPVRAAALTTVRAPRASVVHGAAWGRASALRYGVAWTRGCATSDAKKEEEAAAAPEEPAPKAPEEVASGCASEQRVCAPELRGVERRWPLSSRRATVAAPRRV